MLHKELEVLSKLKHKHDVRIDCEPFYNKPTDHVYDGTVTVKSNKDSTKIFDLGNKSWGCIDFLVNVANYYLIF